MIDVEVIVVSWTSFLLFVIFLAGSVRIFGQAGVLTWMKRIFLVIVAAGSIVVWVLNKNFPLDLRIVIYGSYLLLYWALSFSYIIGLFGIPLTSLRIQLLLIIVQAGNQFPKTLLIHQYSRSVIVKQRLLRLQASGEIIKIGKKYDLVSKWSYFMLHTYLLLLLTELYRPVGSKPKLNRYDLSG